MLTSLFILQQSHTFFRVLLCVGLFIPRRQFKVFSAEFMNQGLSKVLSASQLACQQNFFRAYYKIINKGKVEVTALFLGKFTSTFFSIET